MIHLLAAVAALAATPDRDQPAESSNETIVVTAPGGTIDGDDAQRVGRDDIARNGAPDLLAALDRRVPGLSLSQAQGNPWQPTVVYRGFSASPLQGGAQGLAVYVDGARFNQPFGDTVLFDLLPDAAIKSVAVKDASPVYGLNALGGAIAIETRTGRSADGTKLTVSGGSFGRGEARAESGQRSGRLSSFVALDAIHDRGWRAHSPSTLTRGFADVGLDGATAGIHAKLILASTRLTGNGAAPVELLAADRRAVFTYPDITRNGYARASLHPRFSLGGASRVEASLYAQSLVQHSTNGDLVDDPPGAGVVNRSRTHSRSGGALVQLIDDRALFAGTNHLVVGASIDISRTRFDARTEAGRITSSREVASTGVVINDGPGGTVRPVSLVATTRYAGLFASDRLPIVASLSAEIGVRFNIAKVVLDDRRGTELNGRHIFRRLDPGVEFDWDVAPALSLRAGYAQTGRVPTPAELSCADEGAPCSLTNFFVGDPPLRQVVARTWEAGTSGKAGRLSWLLSSYWATNRDDIQLVSSTTLGRAYFRNIGRTRRRGIEATIDYRAGPLALHAGYALSVTTFRTALRLNSPLNPAANGDGTIEVRPGDRLPGVPRHRATASFDYHKPGWTLGADLQAVSGQILFGDEANRVAPTRPYLVAGVSGSVMLGKVSLFGAVANLFDARFATFGTFSPTDQIALGEAPGASNPRSLGPGSPRRISLGMSAHF